MRRFEIGPSMVAVSTQPAGELGQAALDPSLRIRRSQYVASGRFRSLRAMLCLAAVSLLASACGSSPTDDFSMNNDDNYEPVEPDYPYYDESGSSPAPSSSASGSSSGPLGHFMAQKPLPSGSLSCYTFYPDGTVEVRYSASVEADYYGQYEGNAAGGHIVWSSGHEPTTVRSDDGRYKFDSAFAAKTASCY
jgi:hypothetical protein